MLPAPAPQAVLAAPPQTGLAPQRNPAASPTIVFDASALPLGPAGAMGAPATGGTGNSNDDFAARLGADGKGSAQAAQMIDPRTTVTQGTLIPAVLETAIDTDVPGYVRAVVSADVRSFDGTRVLVPRSSRLVGQYKSGLQAGQKRAYVIWTRLIRPDGVSASRARPALPARSTATSSNASARPCSCPSSAGSAPSAATPASSSPAAANPPPPPPSVNPAKSLQPSASDKANPSASSPQKTSTSQR
jgi:type IV secretory pathway VirB10-like protein